MKALRSLKTSETVCQVTQCDIPEGVNLQQGCCENIKSSNKTLVEVSIGHFV
jgi:hypothetical protein